MNDAEQLLRLCERIDPDRMSFELDALLEDAPAMASSNRIDRKTALCLLLRTAYPSFSTWLTPDGPVARFVEAEELSTSQGHREQAEAIDALLDGKHDDDFQRALREFAAGHRARIAIRELLPREMGGADVDVTSTELSVLADVTIEAALREAEAVVGGRLGRPFRADGQPGRMVVIGMGKLGGLELNCGSDVDLMYFYDTDDAELRQADGSEGDATVHEYWSRVARRMTQTLEEHTQDGIVWRVDLRLRPEGASGAIVNSVAAAESYYESFGRLWERAALLRARPVAGDIEMGQALLQSLGPFVWRRKVDPAVAVEMTRLVRRARAELSDDPDRDLKLGVGGIREAEFFVQSLALIWGGREPSVRAQGTLDALSRLGARGLLTDREGVGLFDAYLALRRAEHAVQWSSGVQTHSLPSDRQELTRIARALGFDAAEELETELRRHRDFVEAAFTSLVPQQEEATPKWPKAIAALDAGERDAFAHALDRWLPPGAAQGRSAR